MKKFFTNIIILILLVIIGICGYRIYDKLNQYKAADDLYDDLRQQKEEFMESKPAEEQIEDKPSKKDEESTENTIDMSSINKDFVGWINVDNTNIDYPIVQSDDNSYYLHRDIYKNYLYTGTIFLDYRCDYENSKNLIIYGHNMKNKTIFSQLENFKKEDFFYSDRKITLTNKDGERKFKVFAVIVVDGKYDYRIPSFDTDEEFSDYINRIESKSKFKSKEKISSDDTILTLSTCSYEFDNARTVVFAKEIK